MRACHVGKDQSYVAQDHDARRVAQYILEHHDRWANTAGGTFEQTAYWLNAQKIYRPDGKRWRRTAVMNWYYPAKIGFQLPNGRREAFPIPVEAIALADHEYIASDGD